MAEISRFNILDIFSRMAREGDPGPYDVVIRMVYNKFCKLTEGRELSEDEVQKCEYAAAAEVAYRYALEKAGNEKLTTSQYGRIKRSCADDGVIEVAEKRRDHAFAELVGIISIEDGFLFRTMKG